MRLEIAARQDRTLQKYRDELREFSELRNAIVHFHGFPAEIIAEPTQEALERLRFIVEQIVDPARLIPTFASEVKCFQSDSPLLDAMRFMDQQGFSQVPVIIDGTLGLLTTEGIGRWLTRTADANMAGLAVKDVLPRERAGNFALMSAHDTVEHARDTFQRSVARGVRLNAILVTKDGANKCPVLGIVTASDLLEQQYEEEHPD